VPWADGGQLKMSKLHHDLKIEKEFLLALRIRDKQHGAVKLYYRNRYKPYLPNCIFVFVAASFAQFPL
jgi:hypothetical protein